MKANNPTTLNVLDELHPLTNECNALRKWREDLVKDLRGEEGLTLMQRELIEQATRLKLYLDRMDAPHLPKKNTAAMPRQDRRMQHRKMLVETLKLLGMDSAPKKSEGKKGVPSLDDIKARYAKKRRRTA